MRNCVSMPHEQAAHFQHPAAIVETIRVGPRTRIWAFAHILPGANAPMGPDSAISATTHLSTMSLSATA